MKIAILLAGLIATPAMARDCDPSWVCVSKAVEAHAMQLSKRACPRCSVAEMTAIMGRMEFLLGSFDDAQDLACVTVSRVNGHEKAKAKFHRQCYGS